MGSFPKLLATIETSMTENNIIDRVSRPKSRLAFERAQKLIPGGVNSPARAFGAVGGHPLFIARAKGQFLYDIDGNRYLDYIGSWGPMILGHAHPQVIEAIQRAAENGTSYGAPTELESELAELVIACVPSIEKVRFVSSGTEATMSAIRLARGATGRSKIIKFAGNYHGHVDSLLVSAGSSAATLGVPDSPGVTTGTSNDRIRCSLDVVGISHFGTFLKNTESYRRDLRRVEYGDERDPAIAAFFEKMAPLNNASKITKPLFVVQGGNDPRVPRTEAEQMVAKVKENQSPVWYLMAKDEGHGFRKKNNADFQFYATTLFVKKYLLDEKTSQ